MTTPEDLWTVLAATVGGTTVLTAAAGALIYVTRGAIAVAVTQAGAREVERLKGDLAKDLERDRHAFAKDLERERMAFARELEGDRQRTTAALEQFKAQLTLDAETRRQAAAKKVEAILRVSEATISLMRVFLGLGSQAQARFDATLALARTKVEGDVLFSTAARDAMARFFATATTTNTALTTIEMGQTSDALATMKAHEKLEVDQRALFDALRAELGTDDEGR
ncbi:MAG: hypothetical protein ACRENE_04100 [Polyangiaceae bacterium]